MQVQEGRSEVEKLREDVRTLEDSLKDPSKHPFTNAFKRSPGQFIAKPGGVDVKPNPSRNGPSTPKQDAAVVTVKKNINTIKDLKIKLAHKVKDERIGCINLAELKVCPAFSKFLLNILNNLFGGLDTTSIALCHKSKWCLDRPNDASARQHQLQHCDAVFTTMCWIMIIPTPYHSYSWVIIIVCFLCARLVSLRSRRVASLPGHISRTPGNCSLA